MQPIALIFAVAISAQVQSALPAPQLERIVVERDTVFFGERVYRSDTVTFEYAFIRDGGSFVRFAEPRRVSVPARLPQGAEAVHMTSDLALVRIAAEDGSSECGHGRYGVRDREQDKTYMIEPHLSSAQRRGLFPEAELWAPGRGVLAGSPVSNMISAWTVDGVSLWFGLWGYELEGQACVGGLLHLDRATHALHSIWRKELRFAGVRGLAVVGGRLWLAVVAIKERSIGGPGLLALDLDSGEWSRWPGEAGAPPGSALIALAADDEALWMTSPRGVARLNPASNEWTVATLRPGLDEGKVVHELVAEPQPIDTVENAILTLAGSLRLEDARPFVAAARTMPAERFVSYYSGAEAAVQTLGDPILLPFVVQAAGAGSWFARHVLAELADSELQLILEALDSLEPERARRTAVALHRQHLSFGRAWLRRNLQPGPDPERTRQAIMALPQMADSTAPVLLAGLLRYPAFRHQAAVALLGMDDPVGWEAVHRVVLEERDWDEFLALAGDRKLRDHPALASLGVEVASRVDSSGVVAVRLAIASQLVDLGVTSAVPLLIGTFRVARADEGLAVMEALAMATGVDSAPVTRTGADQRAEWETFWSEWWRTNGAEFTYPLYGARYNGLWIWKLRGRDEEHEQQGSAKEPEPETPTARP